MLKTETKEGERFVEAMKRIVSVPKAEIERREAQYRKMRANAKKIEKDL